jgi:hypothetical protein
MKNIEIIAAANSLMVQRLARSYLSLKDAAPYRALEGACITTRRAANRTNVPCDAVTLVHLVEHHELGFTFRFRTVWRSGQLLQPLATHVVIEQEWDDSDLGSPAAVSAAINEWLQAVAS